MAYSWKVLANDWSALTDTEKEALFVGTNYHKPTVAELQSLGDKFKIVAYGVDTAVPKTVVKAVPNNKLFVPVSLFGGSFSTIDNMYISANVDANSNIKFVFTKDLVDYYTFTSSGFAKISAFDADTVISEGMSMSDVASISEMQWDTFFSADNGDKGIAMAFAMSMTGISDVAYLDNLRVTADMRGEWRKAVHGTDYDYAYPNNTVLKVELGSDGNYKINYAISSSGGGGLDTGVPIGTVISFMGNTPPDDYLSCDGNVYRINDYSPLANFIHLQFGSYDYFGGDGVDTFAVPDLRGEFLRGTGTNSHKNAFGELQGSGSDVGKHQSGTRMSVPLTFSGSNSASDTGWFGAYIPSKSARQPIISSLDADYVLKNSVGLKVHSPAILNTSTYLNKETVQVVRPTNTSVLYCIKYK